MNIKTGQKNTKLGELLKSFKIKLRIKKKRIRKSPPMEIVETNTEHSILSRECLARS